MRQFDFAIGARVHCQDGRAGVLHKVVVDPHSRRVIDLITGKGLLQKKDRVLPISVVEKTTAEDISLTIQSRDLPNYPEYLEIEFAEPSPGWEPGSHFRREEIRHWANRYGFEGSGNPVIPMVKKHRAEGISSDLEAIGRHTPVRNRDGVIGKIDHVLTDQETQKVTHLVIQKGMLPHLLVIPMDWVENVDDEGIYIRGRQTDLKEFAHYTPRPSADVLDEVRTELRKASFDYHDVVTSLERGLVRLSGIVKNVVAKRHAEQLAQSVTGVIDVDNRLDTSTAIAARVTAALESDPRTHLSVIEVVNEHGVVTLSGDVASASIRKAAEAVTAKQPGVMAVINELEVKPHGHGANWFDSTSTLSFAAPKRERQ